MSNNPKSQLLDFIEDMRRVNCYKGAMLDQDYYVSEGKMYKKLKCGKYRPLKEQENFCHYRHFLVNDTNHRRRTVNIRSLHKLTFETVKKEPKIKLVDSAEKLEYFLLNPD
jgi:hypothetical protein